MSPTDRAKPGWPEDFRAHRSASGVTQIEAGLAIVIAWSVFATTLLPLVTVLPAIQTGGEPAADPCMGKALNIVFCSGVSDDVNTCLRRQRQPPCD